MFDSFQFSWQQQKEDEIGQNEIARVLAVWKYCRDITFIEIGNKLQSTDVLNAAAMVSMVMWFCRFVLYSHPYSIQMQYCGKISIQLFTPRYCNIFFWTHTQSNIFICVFGVVIFSGDGDVALALLRSLLFFEHFFLLHSKLFQNTALFCNWFWLKLNVSQPYFNVCSSVQLRKTDKYMQIRKMEMNSVKKHKFSFLSNWESGFNEEKVKPRSSVKFLHLPADFTLYTHPCVLVPIFWSSMCLHIISFIKSKPISVAKNHTKWISPQFYRNTRRKRD